MSDRKALFNSILGRCRPHLAPIVTLPVFFSSLRALTLCLFLVFMASADSYAGTLFGSVENDSGPVAGARVIAWPDNEIAATDGTGHFSVDIPDGFYELFAEFVDGDSRQYNFPVGVNVSATRKVRLFIAPEVTISGTVELPTGYSNNWNVTAYNLDEIFREFANATSDDTFEITVPAGKYALARIMQKI